MEEVDEDFWQAGGGRRGYPDFYLKPLSSRC